jgi:hypothetical protein
MESGAPDGPEAQAEGPAAWPAPPGWPAPPAGAAAWPPRPGAVPGWNPAPPPPGGGAPPPAVPGWNSGLPAPVVGQGRFRPMGVGELVDASLSLYRRNFLLIVAIAAVIHVPFALLTLLLFQLSGVGGALDTAGVHTGFSAFSAGDPGTPTAAQMSALKALVAYGAVVGAIQILVILPITLAAMSRAVSDRYLGRPATLGSSYAVALRRGGPLVGAILLVVLLVAAEVVVAAVLVGALSLLGPFGVVPAIGVVIGLVAALLITAVRSTLLAQAIVIEGVGSVTGIRRSWQLTRGAFWRTLGILAVVLVLQAFVGGLLAVPLGLATAGAPTSVQQLVSQVAQAISEVFVSPLSLIALTLVYYDMRIRREAFDIEMLAASL